MKFFALIAVASAVSISAPYTASEDGALLPEASANPTVNDRTGTYSPKANMWTGFEDLKPENPHPSPTDPPELTHPSKESSPTPTTTTLSTREVPIKDQTERCERFGL